MTSWPERPAPGVRLRLYSRTARRAVSRYGIRPTGVFGRINRYPVFVVGCPRSGTTFTAGALGNVTGFADLGEVNRLKAGIPELYAAVQAGAEAAVEKELRVIIARSQRVAMAARSRAIEQTPESTFLIPQLARAFPTAHFVHLVRDGRDVVASLVERGWLAGGATQAVAARAGGELVDDAGHTFGGYARFWVESGREREFETVGEVQRCAWAWRRYVTAARTALADVDASRVTTIRYEQLTESPADVAAGLAADLAVPGVASELTAALGKVHARSVGRYATLLDAEGLAAVQAEAGGLLTELGYLTESA